MLNDKLQKYLEVITEEEKVRLSVLRNAVWSNLKQYKESNAALDLKNWQAAEKGFSEYITYLETKYFSEAPSAPVFANKMEVVRFLQGEGYDVKKSTVYNAANSGKLVTRADDSITEADALAYAAKYLKKKPDGAGQKGSKVADEKAKEDLEIARLKRAKMAFEFEKEQGKYILKTDARAEIAIKIAALEAGIKHFFRTNLADWIHMVGGRAEKSHMLLDLIYAEFDGLLNEFGRMDDISVVVKKFAEADPDPVGDEDAGGVFGIDDPQIFDDLTEAV